MSCFSPSICFCKLSILWIYSLSLKSSKSALTPFISSLNVFTLPDKLVRFEFVVDRLFSTVDTLVVILLTVLVLFPYIDANFFYYNRVNDRIDIDGEASIKGIGGTAEGNSCGILAQGIFMKSGCGAKLEGISDRSNGSSVGIECSVFIMDGGEVIGTGNTSVSSASCGIHIEGISVSDGRIEASSGNTSFGLYSESTADFSGNASVALKSADAKVTSCGLYSESFSAEQDVNIKAIGGDAEYAYGVAVTEAAVTGNTVIDALAGNGVARSAGIYIYNSSTVNGNSKLMATAGKASEFTPTAVLQSGVMLRLLQRLTHQSKVMVLQ